MTLDIYVAEDIRANVLAGLVLAIRTSHSQGSVNVDFVAGAVTMAQHTALGVKVEWQPLIDQARGLLGDDLGTLLDGVTTYAIEGGGVR